MEYGKFNGWAVLLFHLLPLTALQLGHALKHNCLAQPLTHGRDKGRGNDATIHFSVVFPTTSRDVQAAKVHCNNGGTGSLHAWSRLLIGARAFDIKCTALMPDTVVRLVLWTAPGRRGHKGILNVSNPAGTTHKQTYFSCSCYGSRSQFDRCVMKLEGDAYKRNGTATHYPTVTDREIPSLGSTSVLAYVLPWCLNCLTSVHSLESENSMNGKLLRLSKGKFTLNSTDVSLKVQALPRRLQPNHNVFNHGTALNGAEKKKRQKRNLACPLEKFGLNCEHSCYCALSKPCHTVTGACSDNQCALGWAGPSCSERACGNTDYLDVENQHCLPCPCNNSDCDILTGRCHESCGREASCVQQQCSRHFFAPPNCKRKCSCWAHGACHPVTGMCLMETCISDLYEPPTCSEPHPRVSVFHIMNAMVILAVLVITKMFVFLVMARSSRERLSEDFTGLPMKADEKVKYFLSNEESTGMSQEEDGGKDTGANGIEEAGAGVADGGIEK